jgi:hypothetical protein
LNSQFGFLNATLRFSVAGFFIPGLTAAALFGLFLLLTTLGFTCAFSWSSLCFLATITALILPVKFYKYLQSQETFYLGSLKTKLIYFNLAEYTLIQCSLSQLFTDGETICFVSDGQNGIELIFTGWLALPILIAISFFYSKKIGLEQ